jgi:hypothetical protein
MIATGYTTYITLERIARTHNNRLAAMLADTTPLQLIVRLSAVVPA